MGQLRRIFVNHFELARKSRGLGFALTMYPVVFAIASIKHVLRELDGGFEFDRIHGTDTSTPVDIFTLTAAHEGPRISYSASIPVRTAQEIIAALEGMPENWQTFTWLDLGSGKGRSIMVASALPLDRIVGIELSPECHEIAQRNLRRYRPPEQRCHNMDVRLLDATQYAIPEQDTVIFVFNSFGPKIWSTVFGNIRTSYESHPRKMYLIHAGGPVAYYQRSLRECGFLRRVHSNERLGFEIYGSRECAAGNAGR